MFRKTMHVVDVVTHTVVYGCGIALAAVCAVCFGFLGGAL